MLNFSETLKVKIIDLTGALGLDRIAFKPFPNLAAIKRVGKVAGDASVLQQVMGDSMGFVSLKLHIRHASRRANGMRTLQKINQAFHAILLFQSAERGRYCGYQFIAALITAFIAW